MLVRKKKIKPKYKPTVKNFATVQIKAKDGRNGIDGINGRDGLQGLIGVQGPTGSDGVNGLDGKDGASGKDGLDGKDGLKGKDGKQIESIEMFARMMRVTYNDGSTDEIPLRFPSGSGTNPGYAGGGQEPPVKDIRSGADIEVIEKNGIYTISFTGEAEDFMDAEDKANLATTANKLTELVTVQHEQLLRVERELRYIKAHANIVTGEKITDQDIEKDEQ